VINGAAFAQATLKTTPLSYLHPAVRLGGTFLALLTCLVLPPLALLPVSGALVAALAWTGMPAARQLAALKPWAPVALLVVVIHTFTTTWAAPLWRPSVAGAVAGGFAMLRVVCALGSLGILIRITPLDDLVAGLTWWLRPARLLGLRTNDLGLAVAVALGTAPVMLGEGRRIEAVMTLRQTQTCGKVKTRPRSKVVKILRKLFSRARVLVPLVEALARRAEALTLSLRHRRPEPPDPGRVPFLQMMFLIVWAGGLIFWMVGRGVEAVG
jgi:energy-coupling factor transporter transmembrane protein EcfT